MSHAVPDTHFLKALVGFSPAQLGPAGHCEFRYFRLLIILHLGANNKKSEPHRRIPWEALSLQVFLPLARSLSFFGVSRKVHEICLPRKSSNFVSMDVFRPLSGPKQEQRSAVSMSLWFWSTWSGSRYRKKWQGRDSSELAMGASAVAPPGRESPCMILVSC